MAELSNEELYEKLRESIQIILDNQVKLGNKLNALAAQMEDKLDPTYRNVRDIYSMTYNISEDVTKIKRSL